MGVLLNDTGDQSPVYWPEMGKKGSSWISSVKKVFKISPKDLPEKKVII
jgi:hypothetical protein